MDKILLSQQITIAITILIGLFFIWLGYLNNKKIFNNKNYIVGDRDENTFSLTSSLTASALELGFYLVLLLQQLGEG